MPTAPNRTLPPASGLRSGGTRRAGPAGSGPRRASGLLACVACSGDLRGAQRRSHRVAGQGILGARLVGDLLQRIDADVRPLDSPCTPRIGRRDHLRHLVADQGRDIPEGPAPRQHAPACDQHRQRPWRSRVTARLRCCRVRSARRWRGTATTAAARAPGPDRGRLGLLRHQPLLAIEHRDNIRWQAGPDRARLGRRRNRARRRTRAGGGQERPPDDDSVPGAESAADAGSECSDTTAPRSPPWQFRGRQSPSRDQSRLLRPRRAACPPQGRGCSANEGTHDGGADTGRVTSMTYGNMIVGACLLNDRYRDVGSVATCRQRLRRPTRWHQDRRRTIPNAGSDEAGRRGGFGRRARPVRAGSRAPRRPRQRGWPRGSGRASPRTAAPCRQYGLGPRAKIA